MHLGAPVCMIDEQREEEANKKHHVTYQAKIVHEKSARQECKREQNNMSSQHESKRTYKKRMKCFCANNLHLESIAMENRCWLRRFVILLCFAQGSRES